MLAIPFALIRSRLKFTNEGVDTLRRCAAILRVVRVILESTEFQAPQRAEAPIMLDRNCDELEAMKLVVLLATELAKLTHLVVSWWKGRKPIKPTPQECSELDERFF